MSRGRGSRRRVCRRPAALEGEAFDPELLLEVRELFGKLKTYTKPADVEWRVPDPSDALRHTAQQYGCLQALKVSLNSVKNQLSDKDLEVWHRHTNSTNRAGKVIATVRATANPEICTQAWCKFYEILGTFSILPEDALQSGELNTVHLCEAPGAFIAALNHYLKTSQHTRYCDWNWAANTLNPYHEANGGSTTIADDRLLANTLPWWFFGSDDTGDIMSQKHLLELQGFVGNMHRVDLVTADGSFDCQGNPDEQEALVASLHLCEASAALLLLSSGGSLVLKMFTLYEHSSVCLLYLLNCCFCSVSIFKPATSKSGNSEVYVVCLHYEGKDSLRPLLSKLIRHYGPDLASREALFPDWLIPPSFLAQHEQVCSFFHRLQVDTITENLRLFGAVSAEHSHKLERLRDLTAQEYLQRFQVSPLARGSWLSRSTVAPACCSATGVRSLGRPLGQRQQIGSFNERQELQASGWRQRVERGRYAAWVQEHLSEDAGPWGALCGPLAHCSMDSWYVLVGPALPVVRNSPFCDGAVLAHLNEALEQVMQHIAGEGGATWGHIPACGSCSDTTASAILTQVAELCDITSPSAEGVVPSRRVLVLGSASVWGACVEQLEGLEMIFSAEPSLPPADCATLHDGEAGYQRELLSCVVLSLQNLLPGDALLLPLLSAFTRVTAATVLCLHLVFCSVTFRCPAPYGAVGAVLVCGGFCPPAATRLLPYLKKLCEQMNQLTRGETGDSRQVLQFTPMEELLRGGLTDFLWTMNSAIAKQRLHRLMQT